jgi:ABC-type branched-subunit amino acid transport system substrate-binding protein
LLAAPADTKFTEVGDAALGVMTSSQWELTATHTEQEASNLGKEWFGPSGEEFTTAYQTAYGDASTYHSAGGYAAGLVLQKAIIDADSVDPGAVRAALNAMDLFIFYGGIKFDTSAEAHGLQIAHQMVVVQWQMNTTGELQHAVITPTYVRTSEPLFPLAP